MPAPPATLDVGALNVFRDRRVEDVRVLGNRQVSTQTILNVVRTREGDMFEPAAAEEDYQRIYGLKRFSNVQATVEPTSTGVIVIFTVTEQNQIKSIAYSGNVSIATTELQDAIDLRINQAIDNFRIALARQAIENLYREKNYPHAHVEVPPDPLNQHGALIFNIVEGPNVRVRKIDFRGNRAYSEWKLRQQIRSSYWIWIFNPGTFDPQLVEEDVAALRKFYESKGYFDARVGRKVIVSPDQAEVQVNFVIDEGARYVIDKVVFRFTGTQSLSEQDLRKNLKLLEGQPYDQDGRDRDVREIVRAYSPLGFIYQPQSNNIEYLRIEPRLVYHRDVGKVDLVYEVAEGTRFRIGRILLKGNAKTQDKLVLRELHVTPGQEYNSGELQDAADRLRGTPFYTQVNITPIGDEPDTRDVLVEVTENKTASFTVGAGVSSNGGLGGAISYEQKNFDITNWPSSFQDMFSDRAFTGAGQTFRASFEPGTVNTNASLLFSEPYIFDQPYGFTAEAYLRNRIREDYTDRRIGGRVTFSKRFSYVWSAAVTLRGEQVDITDINEPVLRAPEIVAAEGDHLLTSTTLSIRRDTTNRGPLLYRGSNLAAAWESAGALGGDYTFQRFTIGWDAYQTLGEDMLDRRTVLNYHLNVGYITPDAPFFERFYGGGFGSIRGFEYRGISPRSGLEDDPIGGDFMVAGSIELGFPLATDMLRGVVFVDAGTVEPDLQIDTIRTSVGFGVRLTVPFLGQVPIALDFAFPLTKDDKDEVQYLSFSLGFNR